MPAPVRAEESSWQSGRHHGLNLGYADENVIGYDHPQALIFRNVDKLSSSEIRSRIDDASPTGGESQPLMLSAESLHAQRHGGTWSEVFRRDGWANQVPWLSWFLALELICLIAFPLTWWVLRPLHDRGLLFSRIVGLLLVAWVAWLLVSFGAMQFSIAVICLAMLIVAIPSAVALGLNWREMVGWLREHWRMVVAAEALFVLAYLAFVLIRAANPDLWHPWRGGEKPMELAYFTAVVRSSALPPFDPWFAGGYLNYYYWGYFILSIPTRLTGIPRQLRSIWLCRPCSPLRPPGPAPWRTISSNPPAALGWRLRHPIIRRVAGDGWFRGRECDAGCPVPRRWSASWAR